MTHLILGGVEERECLLLQYLLQSWSRGGRGIVEDMCYERRRAEACVAATETAALLAHAEGVL